MGDLPEFLVSFDPDTGRSLILKPPDEAELASFWPLDEQVTQFLTESDQQTIGTPAAALVGPTPLGKESLVTGLHTQEGNDIRLIGIGYILAPDLDYPGIGQYILDKKALGKGYGSLTIHGLSRFIFNQLDKPAVQALTLDINQPSAASLARAGFFQTAPDLQRPLLTYGAALQQRAAVRAWLLLKPGEPYTFPAGKFRDPSQEELVRARQNVVIQDQRFNVAF